MNAPIVKPNPSRSAGSTAMLEYLARIWPLGASRAALINVYFQDETRTTIKQARRVDKALGNMVESGTLSCFVEGSGRKWYLGEAAQQDALDEAHEPPARYVGVIAPPRQVNVFGSTYQPAPAPAMRPGAQDFLRFPSRGYRC